MRLFHNEDGNSYLDFTNNFYLRTSSGTPTSALTILQNGNVGIGTTGPDYKLDVNGKIRCEEVIVIADVPSSDYVFEKDYNLRTLTEVEEFISNNKHLPEVPSAQEFKENGYSVGDMDDILLRKIEELTLYTIAQEKELAKQKIDNKILKSKIQNLESENNELKIKIDQNKELENRINKIELLLNQRQN